MGVKLDNTLVLLIGFAGTGKYTVGRELCDRTGAKLIDNHLINNSIFTVVNADGITPLPTGVWTKVKEIRQIVYSAIRELAPPHLSFVFTMELIEGKPGELGGFLDLAQLAADRNSLFVPIRMICDVDELCRRVTDPGRVKMLKAISAEAARRKGTEEMVLNPTHPNLRTLNVTNMSVKETVESILREIDLLKGLVKD
ncbi:MAG TPA: hypothetical protein VKB46_06230 [Pyrinomonadaceae bacterium]|nr:hypothetical protein [Pyrinomonadaceae bacterium]